MRLICGILRLDGTDADETQLRAMAESMRGATLSPVLGLWRDGPIAMAVLDFAPGASAGPCRLDDGVVAADVRLDEPERVAAAIGEPSAAQDRLLAATFARSGADGIASLLGDFAFAHWDAARSVLTCGRDAIGVRPLNYVHVPGRLFAFASLPTAIHAAGLAPRQLDIEALAKRMAFLDRDTSLLKDIHRLPPAHLLRVSPAGLALSRYWAPDPTTLGRCTDPPETAASTLRALIEQAVRSRIAGTGAVGTHLSGGLDSSAVAIIAARALRDEGRTLHAYSLLDRLRNDAALPDETPFVQDVLQQESDIAWTPIRPPVATDSIPILDIEGNAPPHDDVPETQICRHARAHGVQLILSGLGGDEIASFNGRGALAELFVRGRWPSFATLLKKMAAARNSPLATTLYYHAVTYVAPRWVARAIRATTGHGRPPKAFELQEAFQGPRMRALLAKSQRKRVLGWNARQNRLNLFGSGHIPAGCEHWAREGARQGLAYAFPLLDRRVIDYALSLPSAYFLKDGIGRAVFRDAMKGILPDTIRHRQSKFNPFPTSPFDRADLKAHYLARIDAFEQSPLVREWVDLAHLRAAVETIPTREQLDMLLTGNKAPPEIQLGAMAVSRIQYCEFLLQHEAAAEGGATTD